MQKEHVVDMAVLFYISLLLIFVILNLIKDIDYLDIIYLISLICFLFKYLIIKRR